MKLKMPWQRQRERKKPFLKKCVVYTSDVIQLGRSVRGAPTTAVTTRSRVRIRAVQALSFFKCRDAGRWQHNFKANILKCFFNFPSDAQLALFWFLRYSANPVNAVKITLICPEFMNIHFTFRQKKCSLFILVYK